MAKIALNLYEVRKDKNAVAGKTMPAYEAKIAMFMFGSENVTLVESGVKSVELDPAGEEERLMQSYGAPVVSEVFGKEPGRIAELAEAEAAKGAKPAKAKAEPAKAE